jgi:hypothetical protein
VLLHVVAHLGRHVARALERRAVRELQVAEHVTLVLGGDETRRDAHEQKHAKTKYQNEGDERKNPVLQQESHAVQEPPRDPGEADVERVEDARFVVTGFHEQRA